MNYSKQDQLEACVERHRADFDLHEPRPELWAALEKQLYDSATDLTEPVMSVVGGNAATTSPQAEPSVEQPASRKRWAWAEHYSIAAALAVLILAAGLGEAWKSGQATNERVAATVATELPVGNVADAALYLGPSGELLANEVNHTTNARLDTAVRGMETYYVSQLADRKAELGQLSPEAVAECSRELADLDSLYRQLKRELPSHPQPEVVLTAMNRNLQYRLDILNRQLELRNPTQPALAGETRSEYALADSRQSSASSLRHGH